MNKGSEIHLSISSKKGPPLRKYPIVVKSAPAKPPPPPMKQRAPVMPVQSNISDDDDDGDSDDAHFIGDAISPRRKTYRIREPFSWSIFIGFAWLAVVTLFIIIHTLFASPPIASLTDRAIVPLIEMKKESNKYELAFNLVPDEGTKGKLLTVMLPQMIFENVIRYDVCCYQSNYYLCRAITRNLGVDAYLTKDKTAVIQVIHPDMTGARCTIMWNEKLQ